MTIALDTEFTPVCEAEPVPRLVCVQLAGVFGSVVLVQHDPRLPAILHAAFAEGITGANVQTDVRVIGRRFPALWPAMIDAYSHDRVRDVLLNDQTIDIADGVLTTDFGLGACVEKRTGLVLDKGSEWRLRFGELLGLELADWPADARRYADQDAIGTFALDVVQQTRADVLRVQYDNARADLALTMQSFRGIHTDAAWVSALDDRLGTEIEYLTGLAMASGLAKYRAKYKRPSPIVFSTKAAQAMFEAAALADRSLIVTKTKPSTKHPEGQISVGGEALEAAGFMPGRVEVFNGVPVLVHAGRWERAIDSFTHGKRKPTEAERLAALAVDGIFDVHALEAFRMGKAKRTWRKRVVPVLRHPLVRTSYSAIVDSGRTSSHGFADDGIYSFWSAASTNLQNQDRDDRVRGCLIPPPDHVFVISDFGMLELVALAQVELDLFGRSALADALIQGIDVHAQFGADMIGIQYHEFNKKIPAHASARQGGKAWNFGKPGGMGQKRFIAWARKTYRVEVTPEQEREHTRRWLARYPEHDMFFRYVRTRQSGMRWSPKRQQMEPVFKITVPRCGHVRGGMGFPDACNTHFQTLGAYIAKRSLWALFVAGLDPASPMFGAYQVLFVHDEHVTVSTRERAEAVAREQERIMIAASAELAPDVPIKIETIITERYGKG